MQGSLLSSASSFDVNLCLARRLSILIYFNFCSLLPLRRKLLCCSEWVSVTIESEPITNSDDFDPIFPILETSPETEFSSEYFTEMLLSYISGPRVVKYGIL